MVVERTTRYVVLGPVPIERTGDAVHDSLVAALARVPAHLRRTLTCDQGAGTQSRTHHAPTGSRCPATDSHIP